MQVDNPFFHRGPIRDRAYFFGRQDDTRRILSLVSNGQSISLVAQRRLGKTSLLFHIADPDILQQHRLYPQRYLFVYIDCGGLTSLDQTGVFEALCDEIDRVALAGLNRLDEAAPQEPYRKLSQLCRHLAAQDYQLILMLDEFEQMSHNPTLSPDFFSALRALASHHRLAFVTASKTPLLELTYANASALSSPFFNIFASIRLPLFSPQDAADLLTRLCASGGVRFSDAVLDQILALGGTHPLLLQIAGYHAFELHLAQPDLPLETMRQELQRMFWEHAEAHFSYYWQNLSVSEQRALATLPVQQESGEMMQALERRALLRYNGADYDYFAPSFQQFVAQQHVPGLLKSGPVIIDIQRHSTLLNGAYLNLTPLQFRLLSTLVAQAGQVLSSDELEQRLWGEVYVDDPERLKSVIKGLRRSLGDEAARLDNLRSVGYVWRGDA